MKIINKTTWDSKDIREFANKVLKKEAHQLDTLVIKYQQGMVAGRGSYSRRWISLSFPNWKWEKIGSDRINGIKQPFQVIENDKLKALSLLLIEFKNEPTLVFCSHRDRKSTRLNSSH